MFTILDSITISRPTADVFAFVADYRNDPHWRKGVVAMTHVPEGVPMVGTITHETMRILGRSAVTVARVTDYIPGQLAAFCSVEGPVACEGSRTFEPVGSDTCFTYSLTLKPEGLWRWLTPVLKLVFAQQLRGDLVRLKQFIELELP